MIEQTEKEILESELGFYLYEIGQSSDEERRSIEQLYNERINTILQRISEIEANG